MSERVVIDNAALAQLLKGQQGPVFRYVSEVATRVQQRAKSHVGVGGKVTLGFPVLARGKHLRDSIVKRVLPDSKEGFAIEVGSALPYALYHHEGTRPHKIIPHNKALAFAWPKVGAVVIVPPGGGRPTGKMGKYFIIGKGHVDHPGTKANPFLVRAAQEEGLSVRKLR